MNNLKDKLLALAESRLELLDYSSDEIAAIDLDNYSIGELVLMVIGANEEIFDGEEPKSTKNKNNQLVEYSINDKELEYLKKIEVYDIPMNDKYIQLSLINFA